MDYVSGPYFQKVFLKMKLYISLKRPDFISRVALNFIGLTTLAAD